MIVIFQIICAWCGWEIGRSFTNGDFDQTSHGICENCLARELSRTNCASWFDHDLGEAGA